MWDWHGVWLVVPGLDNEDREIPRANWLRGQALSLSKKPWLNELGRRAIRKDSQHQRCSSWSICTCEPVCTHAPIHMQMWIQTDTTQRYNKTSNNDKGLWQSLLKHPKLPGEEDCHGKHHTGKAYHSKKFPAKHNFSIHTLHRLVICQPYCAHSYTPAWLAVADCLFTLQGSVPCSRNVTRYGLEKARPVWKREQDAWLFSSRN